MGGYVICRSCVTLSGTWVDCPQALIYDNWDLLKNVFTDVYSATDYQANQISQSAAYATRPGRFAGVMYVAVGVRAHDCAVEVVRIAVQWQGCDALLCCVAGLESCVVITEMSVWFPFVALLCSFLLLAVAGLLFTGIVFAAKIIRVKKLVVITFTIANNIVLGVGVFLTLAGSCMAYTTAFQAAYDLKVSEV